MKIELMLVGSKLFEKTKFIVIAKDIFTTRIELSRGRKRVVFELLDQQGKPIPISHGVIAKDHIVGTNLAFKTKDDQRKFEDDQFRGVINILMTIFDSDTFIAHADKIKILNSRMENEIQSYTQKLQDKDAEWEKRLQAIQDPYERIIAQKNLKIQRLTSEQMIATLKFEEHLIALIEGSINKDLKEVLGIDKENLSEEATKLTSE